MDEVRLLVPEAPRKGSGEWWPTRHSVQEKVREMWGEEEVVGRWAGL